MPDNMAGFAGERLEQLKQMAQNPQTKPIVEQMAKANGCQTVEEFLGKLEKQLSGLKEQDKGSC